MVTIKNAEDIVVAVWNNVQLEQGFALVEYQLSDDIIEGYWIIEAHGKMKVIEVKKYVLPRFRIQTKHPEEIYRKAEILNFKVCAR